jgi:hypothetical protein
MDFSRKLYKLHNIKWGKEVMGMANGHGGARPGAGRKKKPLADVLLEGNPGKRPPQILAFAPGAVPDTTPPLWLDEMAALEVELDVTDIYKRTVLWLERTGCLHLINPDFIADYALLKTRWMECELIVKQLMLRGLGLPSSAPELGLKYLKQAELAWQKIWRIVAENSTQTLSGDPNDEMAKIMNMDLED